MSYWLPTLKNKRQSAKLTQEQLEDLTSVSRQTIARVERGESCNRISAERLGEVLCLEQGVDVIYEIDESNIEIEGGFTIDPQDISLEIISYNELSGSEISRLKKVYENLEEILDEGFLSWMLPFKYELPENRESEIKLWEAMSVAFARFKLIFKPSLEKKIEAFGYIQMRSMYSKVGMKARFEASALSKNELKKLGALCKFKARPLGVLERA